MNAWKANTDLDDVTKTMRPIEVIRRRLDIAMPTWARWMGMSREHYSALVNGREASKYHKAHLALAREIAAEHRRHCHLGNDEGQLLEKLESLYGSAG